SSRRWRGTRTGATMTVAASGAPGQPDLREPGHGGWCELLVAATPQATAGNGSRSPRSPTLPLPEPPWQLPPPRPSPPVSPSEKLPGGVTAALNHRFPPARNGAGTCNRFAG